MTGASRAEIWDRMAYAEGLQFHMLFVQELNRDAIRHDILCASLSGGGGQIRRLEVRRLSDCSQTEILV
jgi:hypothetical protein